MNYPQQQYPQQNQPGYPQQAYAQAPAPQPTYPQAPQQQYPAQPQPGYPQQAPYQPPYTPQPQQAPAAPLADGSIDAFYSQPNTGGGPGVSWKGKPDGYTVQGVVPRDVTNADVTQEVGAPNTQQAGVPQTYRDGRPKFVMAVPLQLPASQEFPEGEARLFVRGQLRDELTRAMSEAGHSGAPKAGSVITVTLRERKQGRGTIPQNVFSVVYTPPGGHSRAVQPSPQGPSQFQPQQFAPAPQGPSQFQPQQFAPAPQGQQYAPAPGAPSPAPGAQQGAPMTQGGGQQPPTWAQPAQPEQRAPQYAQQAPTQPQHQAPAPSAPQPPNGLTAEQQALIAQLGAGQPAA